jgi:hypothetical protein
MPSSSSSSTSRRLAAELRASCFVFEDFPAKIQIFREGDQFSILVRRATVFGENRKICPFVDQERKSITFCDCASEREPKLREERREREKERERRERVSVAVSCNCENNAL